MRKRMMMGVATAAALLALSGCGSSSDDTTSGVTESDTYKVALWGDQFYATDAALLASMKEDLIASVNGRNVALTLFAGDSKNGSSVCSDEAIGTIPAAIFNSFEAPTIYSLGDNEWTDCHRINNGGYDALERLSFLRQTFFTSENSQGVTPLSLTRQGTPGEAYSENSRLSYNGVTFVSLHIIGSNNNLVPDGECLSTKSVRTLEDCDAANAEYQARNVQNLAWLSDSFTSAKNAGDKGVMIVIQADPEFEDDNATDNGFIDFINTLRDETKAYSGKVVLVHGDSHYFRIDKPLRDTDGTLLKNFTRVEVFGSTEADWVEATVNPADPNLFSFEPVISAETASTAL